MRNPADVTATEPDRGRYSARRKTKAILGLLRGEDIDVVSREFGVTAATVAGWRDHFLAGGQSALKTRQPDARDGEVMRLKAKIGDLTMENELIDEGRGAEVEAEPPFGIQEVEDMSQTVSRPRT